MCCEKEKHHKSERRRCSQIAWQQWGERPYFSIILYKNVSKEEHAGKNPNPDIADSHTPQIIIKIYIPGIYKDLKWFKRGERAQMMRNYAPMQSLQHYTLKNTPWLKYTITDNSNWSWMVGCPLKGLWKKKRKLKSGLKTEQEERQNKHKDQWIYEIFSVCNIRKQPGERKGVMVVKIVGKLLVGFQQQPKGSNSFL